MRPFLLVLALALWTTGCSDPKDPDNRTEGGSSAPTPTVTDSATVYLQTTDKPLDAASIAKGIDVTLELIQANDSFERTRIEPADWAALVAKERIGKGFTDGALVDFVLASPRKVTLSISNGPKVDVNVTRLLVGPMREGDLYPYVIVIQTDTKTYDVGKPTVPDSFSAWAESAKLHE